MSTRSSLPLLTALAATLVATPLALAQTRPDGAPGNPPSTAVGRAVDRAQGETPRPDGTPGNPPGTVLDRALDRVGRPDTSNTNSPSPAATTGTPTNLVRVDPASLRGGRRAGNLIGADIYGANDQDIGEVEDLIIPPGGTSAPVAVLSVGGFLGIGERHVAVPYAQLQYNAERERWMLPGATQDSLRALPAFAFDEDRRGRARHSATGVPTGTSAPHTGTMGGGGPTGGAPTPGSPLGPLR